MSEESAKTGGWSRGPDVPPASPIFTRSAAWSTTQTRYGGRSYNKTEWDDLLGRHEMYLLALVYMLLIISVVIAVLSVFGHTTDGFYYRHGHLVIYGGIWKYCVSYNKGRTTRCSSVTEALLENERHPLYTWGDTYPTYVASRAFLIIAQIYNLPLIVASIVIVLKRLFNPYLFCAMTLTGFMLLVWLVVAAAVTTALFNDNGWPGQSNSGWSVHSLWACMVMSVMCVVLPGIMCWTGKRIEDMRKEDARQQYEPIQDNNNVDVRVEHYE